jgi:benzoyl-CoA-dihydrodiol lyase
MSDSDNVARVDYRTEPAKFRHLRLSVEGAVAKIALDIAEDGGIRSGYKLKLNSYDLGVDIELHDALNRVRFEHPEARVVVITGGKPRVFSAGANIFMLAQSSHAWKVNFCKFTNETRNGIEDSSELGGLKFIAAVNGACAGGGYELALACDEIILVDDGYSAVSLPEVPLLGVLPGTGGLTRLIDKRRVRHDLADVFCTSVEGVRGERAVEWGLVDATASPGEFDETVRRRAAQWAQKSDRPAVAKGVRLPRVERSESPEGLDYRYVGVEIDRAGRTATFTVRAPDSAVPEDLAAVEAAGAQFWPLAMSRELDDAILSMRTNELDIGTWILRTEGDIGRVLAADATLLRFRDHWFVREVIGALRRTLARLDVSSRSLFALVDRGSCFAGTLAELAFAADRTYMLDLGEAKQAPRLVVNEANFGLYPLVTGQSRLGRRFYDQREPIGRVRALKNEQLDARTALVLGLVTAAPDEMDWADEVRLALEERSSLSPDALTGLEANLRFGAPENAQARIFGRLSAWQNWIFVRPNAVGETGALKVYGKGDKARFDWQRI